MPHDLRRRWRDPRQRSLHTKLTLGGTLVLLVFGYLVALLMFVGRVGTITFATSLVLGERRMPYRYPEEHPIVG